MLQDLEARTIAKVTARLVPFLVVCYFVAYLDRVNVGFAALTMNADLGLSQTAFGFGAGIFFIAYFIFEVPSNLLLERLGARTWIARIMLSWGLLSGLMACLPWISRVSGLGNEYSFYLLRVLLGIAEAGFFPGIIFYLTLWFPAEYRARIVGYFMAAIPLSTVIGAPVSGILLYLHGGFGLAGWQWLFLIEAIPAVVLAVVVFVYLTDRPEDAGWLARDEQDWLTRKLLVERRQRDSVRTYSVSEVLFDRRVIALSLIYFGAVATNYGLSFFLPQIVKAFGLNTFLTTVVSAAPYLVGVIGMVWWGRRSDQQAERTYHAAIPLFIASAGLVLAVLFADPTLKMIAFCIAGFGIFACLPVFWTLPTAFLSGAAAAAGIAVINSIGNLAGFAGPFAMGWLRDHTGSYTAGLLLLAGLGIIAMGIVLVIGHDPALERAPAAPSE
ncbi:MFS transporter [Bradyrhizobium sp. STM 3809]|uniref:MFS transporter n=1 Tax=Bradyrhizobium sp. STM 3809 TaxID=551936 RepID=UPI0002409344|nr:MFS transporter [Bradyrhizobium sp. STM 3809]CCE01294.1 putative transport protein (MFS superfamily) [Bradyrhizobium sp. STM 3809]